LDLHRNPYIIFVSKGIHTHPPPPPVKTPQQIANDITEIIKATSTINLTAGKYKSYLNHIQTNLNYRTISSKPCLANIFTRKQ